LPEKPLPSTPAWQNGVLDPQGPIAAAERTLLANATLVMLAVIVPVILATLAFAWWFRAGNRHARRDPDWAYSGAVEVTVWAIPTLVIVFLGGLGWIGSHALAPARPIEAKAAPLDVQVVSLDWKWLFVYPSAGVASVDRLVVPAGVPVRLRLTSATVMNSFFVPQLGSQIYTMPGMVSSLNLMADRAGRWWGMSAQFSGDGFADMQFDADALAPGDFARWLADARARPDALDAPAYAALARRAPAGADRGRVYGRVAPALFDAIVRETQADAAPRAGPPASEAQAAACRAPRTASTAVSTPLREAMR
jgi:cytochrome o ubiquinol oxidase subunit 2